MKAVFNMLMLVLIFSAVNLFAQTDNSSELKMKLRPMLDSYEKACLSGNYNAIAGFYTDDAISLPSYQPVMRGKDAILQSEKKDVDEGLKYKTFNIRSSDVYSSGDLAYEIGTYEVDLTSPKMPNEINDHGKYLNVWQRQSDGSWKIKVNTWNSDINPMAMSQAGAKSKEETK